MTLFEPVGKMPEPAALAGFVPCRSEDAVARQLLRPQLDDERETLLLAGFDASIGSSGSSAPMAMRPDAASSRRGAGAVC